MRLDITWGFGFNTELKYFPGINLASVYSLQERRMSPSKQRFQSLIKTEARWCRPGLIQTLHVSKGKPAAQIERSWSLPSTKGLINAFTEVHDERTESFGSFTKTKRVSQVELIFQHAFKNLSVMCLIEVRHWIITAKCLFDYKYVKITVEKIPTKNS